MLYAMGNNPSAARVTGIPFRPMVVAQYAISAFIAYLVAPYIQCGESNIGRQGFSDFSA